MDVRLLTSVFLAVCHFFSVHGACREVANVTCPEPFCSCRVCPKLGLWVTCRSYRRIPLDIPSETVGLHLEYNQISKSEGALLSRLKKLRLLNLSHNKLDSTWMQALDGLSVLEHLYLDHNERFTKITSEMLSPLVGLTKLNISNSNLREISRDAFLRNRNLRRVILKDNLLQLIPETLFHDLPNLFFVDVSHNSLVTLPSGMFNGSPNVSIVNIASNQLLTISSDIGFQYLRHLRQLSVNDNQFNCGCDLVWFRTWVKSTSVFVFTRNLTCSSGIEFLDFRPDDVQCGFPVAQTVAISAACLTILSACALGVSQRWRIRYALFKVKARLHGHEEIHGDFDELYKYDVFISHSRKDEDWVHHTLRRTLENPPYNYRLCLDFRDFAIGDTIVENIIRSIDNSHKTLFVVSKDFIESEWCYFELEMVRQKMFDQHRDLAVILLKENVPADDMPGLLHYLMRRGDHIEWSDNGHVRKNYSGHGWTPL